MTQQVQISINRLTFRLQNIENELIENGGEITAELEAELGLTKDNIKEVGQEIINLIGSLEARELAIKTETARLDSLKKDTEKAINHLRNVLKRGMMDAGIKSVLTSLGSLSLRASTAVMVDEELVNELPDNLKTRKVVETPNRAEIKKALERGEVVKGCFLDHRQNVQIK